MRTWDENFCDDDEAVKKSDQKDLDIDFYESVNK